MLDPVPQRVPRAAAQDRGVGVQDGVDRPIPLRVDAYLQPAAVAGAIVANIVWNNAVRRRRRVSASPIQVISVLLCQEVVHGLGYSHAIVRRKCCWRAHRRAPATPRLRGDADSP